MEKFDDNLTPAMRQYHQIKQTHPDCIIFFRMGDFYETFYEDARTCSTVLGLALTSRSKTDNPTPLAGVPYHAVDSYLKKMIQAGYKVAVCEQTEDPKTAKGVVKREVVRIVTPGTLTDEMLLDAKQDNFLCAVAPGTKGSALAWVDLSTGHFFVERLSDSQLLDEIMRIGPRECLLPQMRGELFESEGRKLSENIKTLTGAAVTERPGWYFDLQSAKAAMLKHFQTVTLEGFGIADDFEGIMAAGAIIVYLNETQKTTLGHIRTIRRLNRSAFLQIDPTSLRSLEILQTGSSGTSRGSLLESIDQTVTGMGSRMLRSWICMPLCDAEAINRRHDAVAELVENTGICDDIRAILKKTSDLERIAARISTCRATPRDMIALAITLKAVPQVRENLQKCCSAILTELAAKADGMDTLADLLESAIEPLPPGHLRDGAVIKPGFNEQLDGLRAISADGRSWLAQFQQDESRRTGISNLRVGFNKVFGYYIEVNHSQVQKVPGDYIRRQTVKNAERYITEQLKNYEQQVLTARDRAIELEQELFEQLRTEAAGHIEGIQNLAHILAVCDCLACFAYIARRNHYIRPAINNGTELVITEGRHPVLALSLGPQFVPNDVAIGTPNTDIAIITGPNMSGKSTYIRQVALLVLLGQAGSFIPAKEASIGIVDRIFTRIGASDELLRGRSTFMVEMTETADIINNATQRSLVILDEVGRGTSTYDGLALAWAITEHIANNIRCRTLFATHFHQLTALADILSNVRNFNVAVREWSGQVIFLHKIIEGGTDKSYGIHVAALAGIPRQIISRSTEVLNDLESTFNREAANTQLSRHRTTDDAQALFVEKHKSVLEKLASMDVNNLTPIEAINLLNQIKDQLNRS